MRRRRLEAKLRVTVRAYLEGSASPTETCLALSPFKTWLPECFTKEEETFITAVNSETDALPVGRLIENWHPDYVAPKLATLARYDELLKEQVRSLCESLLKKLHDTAKREAQDL